MKYKLIVQLKGDHWRIMVCWNLAAHSFLLVRSFTYPNGCD